jgi:pimeloyl-ACP methyl ester carboxylesterase
MTLFLKLVFVAIAGYLAVVGVIWAIQDRLLFPADLAAQGGTPVSPDAKRITLPAADGVTLHGVKLSPPATPMVGRVVILGFGGNAWNAESAAVYLYTLYPQAEVVVFHYRGYAPSTGRASVDTLVADAPMIYDKIAEEIRAETPGVRIVAAGFSIGSGVAVHLARERKLDGLILVTPFDSLAELAAHHFPWLPARSLIRNSMNNAMLLRGLNVPTAILAAEHDEIIPRERTSEMRGAAQRLVYSRTMKDAGHNDIYDHPDFAHAMREALAAIEKTWPY